MHADEPTLQVSHETIYTALYAMLRGVLRTELIACLRQARKSLNWKCPAELFMPESFDFFKHHHQLVALRT